METIKYSEYLKKAYELYKQDWCQSRNFPIEKVEKAYSENMEYKGQMYISFEEFKCSEAIDDDYMKSLLGNDYIDMDSFDEDETYTYESHHEHHLNIKLNTQRDIAEFETIIVNVKGKAVLTGTDSAESVQINAKSIIGTLYATTWSTMTLITDEDVYFKVKKFVVFPRNA